MQGIQKSQRHEMIMAWLAVAVILGMMVSVLLLPLIQGDNIGGVYGEVFNNQVYHEYEYNSTHDYYYPTGTDLYGDDYDFSSSSSSDSDKYFDDSEYRIKAERDEKKIRRDVKHLEKFEDSVSLIDEVRLLMKYIKYIVTVGEDEVISFRYSLGVTILILVMAVVLAAYLLYAFISTLMNLLMQKADIDNIQRRLCRVLFFLIPYIIIVGWQRSLMTNVFFPKVNHSGLSLQDGAELGIGCIFPCGMLVAYLVLYWGIRMNSHLKGEGAVERLLINRLVCFIMMAAAGGGLLLNADRALYSTSVIASSTDLVAESAYRTSYAKYAFETYELEHEDDEDDEDDEGLFKKSKRDEERTFGKMYTILNRRMIAGILMLLGTMFTIQIICSINKATYLNQDVVRHRVWAGLNVALYLTAYLLLLKSNKLELDRIKDFASTSKELYLVGAIIGKAVVLQIALNVFIIVADIWRKYINRALDGRSIVPLPIEGETQEMQE